MAPVLREIARVPHETTFLTIVAQDPSIRVGRKILTAQAPVPAEPVQPGPWGHRVQVIDYDASRQLLYRPQKLVKDRYKNASARTLLSDPNFHQQNTYAIVMRTLGTFERVLGRRLGWGVGAHQLKVVPHAFEDANAFYSREDDGLYFGYFTGRVGPVFTCLSHDIVVHETTHALLDGLRGRFTDPSSPDQAAFHEGFADLVALLSMFQLPETIKELLGRAQPSRSARNRKTVARNFLRDELFVRRILFGVAEELGDSLHRIPGRSLRMSYSARPDPGAYTAAEFAEPYRRGELLVASMLEAFVLVWQARLGPMLRTSTGPLDRERVVEEGAEAAQHLLHLAVRGIDYTPPVHLTFRDYLSAVLTADYEVQRDDTRYHYRDRLRRSFARWGIRPAAHKPDRERAELSPPEPGCWCAMRDSGIDYSGLHQESMRRDPDEVFRFLWQNRGPLRLHPEAYSQVLSVRPCRRLAPDGVPLNETVVEFRQKWEPTQREFRALGLPGTEMALDGGATLIFDDFGRLKYHIHNSVGNIRQQKKRLAYLRESPLQRVPASRRFEVLHRLRAVDPPRLASADRW